MKIQDAKNYNETLQLYYRMDDKTSIDLTYA